MLLTINNYRIKICRVRKILTELNMDTNITEINRSTSTEVQASDRCFPSRRCINYQVVSAINSDIFAGQELLREVGDPEIEAEIQAKREELRAICGACPVSGLTTSLVSEATVLTATIDSRTRIPLGRQATYSDLISTARGMGLNIVGGGNHPFAIEGADGRKFAVPAHPGSLSPRVISNARKFLASYMGA